MSRLYAITLILACIIVPACGQPTTKANGDLSHIVIKPDEIDVHEWGSETDWTPWQREQQKQRPMRVTRAQLLSQLAESADGTSLSWKQSEEGHVNVYMDDQNSTIAVIRENRNGEVVSVGLQKWIDHGTQKPFGRKNARFNELSHLYLKLANVAVPDADIDELRDWLTTTSIRRHANHGLIRGEIPRSHIFKIIHPFTDSIDGEGLNLEMTIQRFPEE